MTEIKKLALLPFAKHCAIFLGFLNLVAALYSTLIFPPIVGQPLPEVGIIFLSLGNNLLLGLLVGFIILGLLGGLLYNLFAKLTGGIKFD